MQMHLSCRLIPALLSNPTPASHTVAVSPLNGGDSKRSGVRKYEFLDPSRGNYSSFKLSNRAVHSEARERNCPESRYSFLIQLHDTDHDFNLKGFRASKISIENVPHHR